METKQLEQEKFDTLKELADMQTAISEGRSELLKLKNTTEEYMVFREEGAEKRVAEVLKKSREALEETTKNQKELSSYNKELQEYSKILKEIASDIMALFKDFEQRMNKADIDLEEGKEEVAELLTDIKIERVQVQEDRKMLQKERLDLEADKKLLVDRQAMLKRGFEELKANKK